MYANKVRIDIGQSLNKVACSTSPMAGPMAISFHAVEKIKNNSNHIGARLQPGPFDHDFAQHPKEFHVNCPVIAVEIILENVEE